MIYLYTFNIDLDYPFAVIFQFICCNISSASYSRSIYVSSRSALSKNKFLTSVSSIASRSRLNLFNFPRAYATSIRATFTLEEQISSSSNIRNHGTQSRNWLENDPATLCRILQYVPTWLCNDAFHVPTYLRTGGLADDAKPCARTQAIFSVEKTFSWYVRNVKFSHSLAYMDRFLSLMKVTYREHASFVACVRSAQN